MKQWVILGFMVMQLSYNGLAVATWWAGYFNNWQITIHLNNIREGYVEGVIWHLTLLLFPWVMLQLLKVLWPPRRNRLNDFNVVPFNDESP